MCVYVSVCTHKCSIALSAKGLEVIYHIKMNSPNLTCEYNFLNKQMEIPGERHDSLDDGNRK